MRIGLKAAMLFAVPMLLVGNPATAATKLLINNFVPETHPSRRRRTAVLSSSFPPRRWRRRRASGT